MHFKKSIVISTLIVGIFSLLGCAANAREYPKLEGSRENLAQLEDVHVSFDIIDDTALINLQQLRFDVERKLRKAGVNVVSKEDWSKAGAHQFIDLVVDIKENAGCGYIFKIELQLKETVDLKRRSPTTATAKTWSASAFKTGDIEDVHEFRDSIDDYVDLFCTDYLTANTIKQGSKDE